MSESMERLKASIEYEIRKYTKQLEIVDKLPDLGERFPQGEWSTRFGWSFEFCLPFDFELMAEVRKYVTEELDLKILREQRFIWEDSKSAGHFIYLDDNVEISFRTTKEGTTCVLHQIGSEVKEVPIFEVTCTEGAADGTFE